MAFWILAMASSYFPFALSALPQLLYGNASFGSIDGLLVFGDGFVVFLLVVEHVAPETASSTLVKRILRWVLDDPFQDFNRFLILSAVTIGGQYIRIDLTSTASAVVCTSNSRSSAGTSKGTPRFGSALA